MAARAKYGESDLIDVSKRLEHVTDDMLKRYGATVHASCRKNVVHSQKLERAKVRFEKAVSSKNINVLLPKAGRPSTSSTPDLAPGPSHEVRLSRSSTARYDKQMCFFCQTYKEKELVHAIQSGIRGKQLHDYVTNCDKDIFKVYLSSAIKPDDALSIDVRYHQTCWTKHVVRGTGTTSVKITKDQYVNENEIAAKIEFLDLIKNLLEAGRILSIDDAHTAYLRILRQHKVDDSPSRKYVRKMINDNIVDIDFIPAPRRNEADRFCLNAAKIAAIEAAVSAADVDSDMRLIFQCAKIVRKVILKSTPWEYDGTLGSDMTEKIPSNLGNLLCWIMAGVSTELQTEKRTSDVDEKACILGQQIMYQVKTDRQMRY